jgi:hypothetical protein
MATAIRSEDRPVVKGSRAAEIGWLLVLIVLVALGGTFVLHALAMRRLVGSIVLLLAIAGTVVAIRRAYNPGSPTVRVDVTKAVAYCCSAVLAFVAIAAKQHWAIGSCIIATEVALAFDLVTVVAQRSDPTAAGGR